MIFALPSRKIIYVLKVIARERYVWIENIEDEYKGT